MSSKYDRPVILPSRLRTLSYFFFLTIGVIGMVFLFSSNSGQQQAGLGLIVGGFLGFLVTRMVRRLI